MARKVGKYFRDMSSETKEALLKTNKMTTNVAYNRLKKKRIKPIMSVTELRRLAKGYGKKYKEDIIVSNDMMGRKYASGTCGVREDNKKVIIHLHPILKYYPEKHIKNVILHEIDHAKVTHKYKGVR
jgi:hypothetical protein